MDAGSSLLMLVVLFAVFYFMLIRPENKRKKQAQAMRDSLKKGDIITTIGGIIGKIVQVKEDSIVIETSEDRVRMELTKWAVSTVGVQSSIDPKEAAKKKAAKAAESEKEEEPAKEEPQEAEELPEEIVDEIPASEEEEKKD